MDSINPWCANKVNEKTGVAIHGEWADCESRCEVEPSISSDEALKKIVGLLGDAFGQGK